MFVYCVVGSKLSPTFELGTSVESFLRREDAERFIEEVRSDDESSPEASASWSVSSS